MSAVQWFSGPPPAVGWWPMGNECYRWFDGKEWSSLALRSDDKWLANRFAGMKWANQKGIRWRHWSIKIDGTDGRGAHL